jgi:hypothetical protein
LKSDSIARRRGTLNATFTRAFPPSAPTLTLWGEGGRVAEATLGRRTFASIALGACSPCSSLLSPFFSLFRRGLGFNFPPKTVSFQMVDQKAPSHAEQDNNREIIRA